MNRWCNMAKETQKAKIERLENELLQAHTIMNEQRQCINDMQAVANDSFANSNDKIQLEKKIEYLEAKLKSVEHGEKLNKSLAEKRDKRLQELISENEKLKSIIQQYKKLGRKTKFDDVEVVEMKQLRAKGETYREIAKRYNCSVGLVHKVVNS